MKNIKTDLSFAGDLSERLVNVQAGSIVSCHREQTCGGEQRLSQDIGLRNDRNADAFLSAPTLNNGIATLKRRVALIMQRFSTARNDMI